MALTAFVVSTAGCREGDKGKAASSGKVSSSSGSASSGTAPTSADQQALNDACAKAKLPPPPDLSRFDAESAAFIKERINQAIQRNDAASLGRLGHLYRVIAEDQDALARATDCYDKAKAAEPKAFQWPYHLARAFHLRTSMERAKLEMQKALELNPEYAMIHGWLGELELNEKRPEKAKPYFEKVVALRPDDAYGHLGLAVCHLRMGDMEAATQSVQRAVAIRPNDRDAHLLLAHAYTQLKKEEDAAKEREIAAKLPGIKPGSLDRDPLEREVWMSLAPVPMIRDRVLTLAASGSLADAISICEGYLAERPNDYDLTILMARIKLDQGQLEEALALLDRAAADKPDKAPAYALQADAFLRQGRAEEAITKAKQALDLDAGIANAHYLLAKALVASGRQEEAQNALAHAAELPVEVAEYWVSLGDLFLEDKKPAEALKCYRKALSLDPVKPPASLDSMKALTGIGRIAAEEGKVLEAGKFFRDALRIQPTNDRALCGMGFVRERQQNTEEAMKLYRQAVQANPFSSFALGVLAEALARHGQYEEALSSLRRAVALDPNNALFRAQLGSILAAANDETSAMAELERALVLDPGMVDARYSIGAIMERRGDAAGAAREWEKVLKEAPGHEMARLSLMGQAYAARNYSAAKEILREGMKHNPESAGLANSLAWVLAVCPEAGHRDGKEAVEWAEKACKLNPTRSAGFLDTLAAAYAEAGRFDEAVKTQREVLDLLSKQPGADLKPFQGRLALYEAGKPYHEG